MSHFEYLEFSWHNFGTICQIWKYNLIIRYEFLFNCVNPRQFFGAHCFLTNISRRYVLLIENSQKKLISFWCSVLFLRYIYKKKLWNFPRSQNQFIFMIRVDIFRLDNDFFYYFYHVSLFCLTQLRLFFIIHLTDMLTFAQLIEW